MSEESSLITEDQPILDTHHSDLAPHKSENGASSEDESSKPIPSLSFEQALSGSNNVKSSNEFRMVDVKEEEEVPFEAPTSAPSSWKSGLTPRKASRPEPVESTYLNTRSVPFSSV